MISPARSTGSRGSPRIPLPDFSPLDFGILILIVTIWTSFILRLRLRTAPSEFRIPAETVCGNSSTHRLQDCTSLSRTPLTPLDIFAISLQTSRYAKRFARLFPSHPATVLPGWPRLLGYSILRLPVETKRD